LPIATTEKPKWKKIKQGIGKVHKSKIEKQRRKKINEINPSVVHGYNQLDKRSIVFSVFIIYSLAKLNLNLDNDI
jgi:hypothetical protein